MYQAFVFMSLFSLVFALDMMEAKRVYVPEENADQAREAKPK